MQGRLARVWQALGGPRAIAAPLELARDEVARLPRRRAGVVLRVLAGQVVVSREGDPEDHVVAAGDSLPVPGRGLALAWALEASQIELRPAEAGELPAGTRRQRGAGASTAVSSLPRVDTVVDSAGGRI